MGLLDGKRILVTGVLTDASIAFSVARLAQEQGAQVILTSFGRQMKITQAVSRRLPTAGRAARGRPARAPAVLSAAALLAVLVARAQEVEHLLADFLQAQPQVHEDLFQLNRVAQDGRQPGGQGARTKSLGEGNDAGRCLSRRPEGAGRTFRQ